MNRVMIHVIIDKVDDKDVMVIKKKIEDALKDVKNVDVEMSVRKSS